MNWIDTPLLVFRSLKDHPAKALAEEELRRERCASTVYVLFELFQILTQTYDVLPDAARRIVTDLMASSFLWAGIDAADAISVVAKRSQLGLESADALLLSLAEADGGTLVTPDRRLLRIAQAEGIRTHNPISPALAVEVARWEDAHLAAKGLPRLLRVVEHWLRLRNEALATEFIDATANFTALPFG